MPLYFYEQVNVCKCFATLSKPTEAMKCYDDERNTQLERKDPSG